MSLTVVLQLELVNRLGAERGTHHYKLLMLSLMRMCCHDACLEGNDQISPDLSMQMIANLARRLAKLEPFSSAHSEVLLGDQPHFSSVRKQVEETVRQIRAKLDAGWLAEIAKVSQATSRRWSSDHSRIFLISLNSLLVEIGDLVQ